MNILFDISHPAHFHLFKHVIRKLENLNHRTLITIRDKDILVDLLNHEKINYQRLAKPRQSFPGLFLELMTRNVAMFRLCHRFKPDLLIGTSVNITHVGRLIGKPSIVVNEDDDDVVPFFSWLAYPLAHRIVNPSCVAFRHWNRKRILHHSYHELSYLHPANFLPDVTALKKYGLNQKQYVIARFSALKAHHDIGAEGISENVWKKIESLLDGYEVLKSFESGKAKKIDPWDMHHILAFAKMIISDSQTMTIEGAVLGIPAVRINTFIGKSTVIQELEDKYRLAFGILPDQTETIIETISALLSDPETDKVWQDRRECLLADKEDFSAWLVRFILGEGLNLSRHC